MGYDIHIVRTDDWIKSETNPILLDEVNKLIGDDDELDWSATDFIEMRERDGSKNRYKVMCWNGVSLFWWYKSEIRCSNPNEKQIIKMVKMAKRLIAVR